MAQDGLFGAMAGGAASGAGMGASIGSAIPGVGTAIGAGIGAIAGGITSGVKQNAANKSQNIPLVDPQERVRLAQLDQISKNLSSGSDVMTKQNVLNQKNIGRAAQNAISKSTGGDVGGTIDALLRSQKATQGGINQAIAQSASRLPYFQGAADQLRTRMSQRRLELDLLKRAQATAGNAQARTENNVNSQSLLATQGGMQTIPEGIGQTLEMIKNSGLFNKQQAAAAAGGQASGQPNAKAIVPSPDFNPMDVHSSQGIMDQIAPSEVVNSLPNSFF